MTATEYFDIYGPQILHNNISFVGSKRVIFEMLICFSKETIQILTTRQIARKDEILQVFEEQNQKWNELHRIFLYRCGFSPIVEDGFIQHWNKRLRL